MKAPRLLTAAAAAAGLLAAGCDYWKNLVDEKNVTRLPLTLTIRDAWTHDSLPDAVCTDSLRDLIEVPASDGRIAIAEAGAGPYAVTCTAPSYYPRTKTFEVRGSGSAVNVDLARRGLEEWYPEDSSRQVKFPVPVESLRYPPRFQLGTLPANNGSVFRYSWSFAQNKNLGQPLTIAKPGILNLILQGSARDVRAPGSDTVTVTVYSALRGPDSLYVVGAYSMPFTWIRNKPPVGIQGSTPAGRPKIGCKDFKELKFKYTAVDTDGGTCTKMVLYTRDTTGALGAVHMEKSCLDAGTVALPVDKRPNSVVDDSGYTDNTLYIDSWDDNNEFSHDSITFQTHGNILPTANVGRVNPQVAYFPRTPVKLWIEGGDADGPVYDMKIDWGDGTVIDTLKDGLSDHFIRDTVSHRYNAPGIWSPILYVADDCPDGAFATLQARDSIRVRDDTKPKIALDTLGYDLDDPQSYRVSLRVLDPDADDGFDSLTVVINWGEGKPDTISSYQRSLETVKLPHRYLAKPGTGGFYQMKVTATDAQYKFESVSQLIPGYRP